MVFIFISSIKMLCSMAKLYNVKDAVQVQTFCSGLRMEWEMMQQHQTREVRPGDISFCSQVKLSVEFIVVVT